MEDEKDSIVCAALKDGVNSTASICQSTVKREHSHKTSQSSSAQEDQTIITRPALLEVDSVNTPVLNLLTSSGGKVTKHTGYNEVIQAVLTGIHGRMLAYPDMILVGRTEDGYRINYHVIETGVTSVAYRMRKISKNRPDTLQPFEDLLRPLASTNQHAFPEIPFPKGGQRTKKRWNLSEKMYKSRLDLLTTSKEREQIGERDPQALIRLLNRLRARCKHTSPDSLLFYDPAILVLWLEVVEPEEVQMLQNVIEWSLFDNNDGLAAKLRGCAGDSKADTVEMVEQVLFSFGRVHPGSHVRIRLEQKSNRVWKYRLGGA
jgi:hypothetical protein